VLRVRIPEPDAATTEPAAGPVAPSPAQLTPQAVARLQATAGNQAIGRMLQRRVIPVYNRAPEDKEAGDKDRREVDQFAKEAALLANNGAIDKDLPSGGSLVGVPPTERIVVTGHGGVGTLQGYSGGEVAEMLVKKWQLPKAYSGTLRLDSCKAGDTGPIWYVDSSLVETVSNTLLGYQVTVEGMKGNVITGGPNSARPGEPRSVGDDQAHADYKRLQKVWHDLEKIRDEAIQKGPSGEALQRAQLASLHLFTLREELKSLDPGDGLVAQMISLTFGASNRMEQIREEIAVTEKKQQADTALAKTERDLVEQQYGVWIQKALDQMDAVGVLWGDSKLTVTHGPKEREAWSFSGAISYMSGETSRLQESSTS
jgi:hypothetical protein